MKTIALIIADDGETITTVYTDEFDLAELGGKVNIRRASHVEPTQGGWTADMSPVGGPVLGPFPKRGLALAAELCWLGEYLETGQPPQAGLIRVECRADGALNVYYPDGDHDVITREEIAEITGEAAA